MGARFPVSRIPHMKQVLLLLVAVFALAADLTRAQATPVEARISSVNGSALLLDGTPTPRAAKRGDVLQPGQEIDTRGGGHLTIELSDGSLVIVAPGSRILLKDFRAARNLRELLDVLLGRVRVKINHFGSRPNPYRINSPTASIAVRGTEFSVAVEPRGDTQVVVYEGTVEVSSFANPRHPVLVQPGHGVIVRPNEDIQFFVPGPNTEIGTRSKGKGASAGDDGDATGEEVTSSGGSLRGAAVVLNRNFKSSFRGAGLPCPLRSQAFRIL